MAQQQRKHRPLPATDTQIGPAPRAQNVWGVLLAVLAVGCYVVLFYNAHDFRRQVLTLILAPDVLLAGWSGNGESPLGILDRLPLIALAMGIVAVAWASGTLFIRGWKLDVWLNRLETELFSIGVGPSLWSLWTLLVGLFGLLHQTWLIWLPAIPVAAFAGFQLAARSGASAAQTPEPAQRGDWLWPSALLLGVPFALLYLGSAVLPPRPNLEFDVLEYHLQMPKEWYEAGSISFVPHNVYGNMPLGAEMYAVLGMSLVPGPSGWWHGALIGKVVMAICGILSSLLLFAAGRRMGSNTAGVVGALVYLSTPWAHLVSVTGRNEGVLTFYLALAVYATWLWRRTTDRPPGEAIVASHLLKLAGFFAGSAAAVKYTAVPMVVLPLLLFVTFGMRRFAWRPGAIFVTGVLVASGLWYVKNIAVAGNPVYPLATAVFGGETWTPAKTEQWANAHRVPPISFTALAHASRRLLIDSPWLSPLLAPLALLALFAQRYYRVSIWLAALLLFYLACWFLFTHRLERFWTPAIVLIAWLAGIGATWSVAPVWRHALIALLFWGSVSNFVLIASGWYVPDAEEKLADPRLAVALPALRQVTTPPAHRWLNEKCPPGYRVLLVGDAQPFNLTMPVLYNTCFDEVWFDRLLQDRTRAERQAALRQHQVAYLLIDWGEIDRYRSPGNYGFSNYVSRDLVQNELVKEQKLLRKVAAHGVWEIYEVVGAMLRPDS